MVVTVITGIVVVAAGTLLIYDKAERDSPEKVSASLRETSRIVGVVLVVCNTFLSVIAALKGFSAIRHQLGTLRGGGNTQWGGAAQLGEI